MQIQLSWRPLIKALQSTGLNKKRTLSIKQTFSHDSFLLRFVTAFDVQGGPKTVKARSIIEYVLQKKASFRDATHFFL